MRPFIFLLFLSLSILPSAVSAQKVKEVWTFKHAETGKLKKFKQQQTILVKWQGISGIKSTVGKLVDITLDSVQLNIQDHKASIAKQDIVEIGIKERHFIDKLFSVTLFLGGLLFLCFGVLLQLAYDFTRTDYQLAHGEHKTYWPWGLPGLILIAWGFSSLQTPTTMRIEKPFAQEWILQEKSGELNKMP